MNSTAHRTAPLPSFVAAIVLALGAHAAPITKVVHSTSNQRELDTFLRRYAAAHDGQEPVTYSVAMVDLNGDGTPEAVVRLTSNGWCGSGGCDMLVLAHRDGGFRKVSSTTITQLPIRLERHRSHGWRDLGVMISGGGIPFGQMSVLAFNGCRYPLNPTAAWAAGRATKPSGRILIGENAPVRTVPAALAKHR